MTSLGVFTKNVAATTATRIVVLIAGVGISVLIARLLGPEGKGLYSLAMIAPSIVVVLANLGIGPATVYHVARNQYPRPEILGSNVWMSFAIGAFAFIIGATVIRLWGETLLPGIQFTYLLLALLLIPIILLTGNLRTIFQGLQRFREFNLVSVAQAILSLLLISVFLLVIRAGVAGAISAALLASLILAAGLLIWTRRVSGGLVLHPNWSYIRGATTFGAKAHMANVLQFLNYRLDLILINGFLNPVAVGFYSIAVGLTERLWLVSQSASTVLYPLVAGETDESVRRSFTPIVSRNVLLITAAGTGIVYALSHWLVVVLYSDAYMPAVRSLQILLPGVVALGASRVLANDLAGRGRPVLNSCVSGIGLVINVALNVVLIPRLGIEGAALATTASYVAMWGLTLALYAAVSGNSPVTVIVPRREDWSLWKQMTAMAARWAVSKARPSEEVARP